MEITIRQEAGYDLSLYGFSLSYKDRAIDPEDWWDFTGCATNCPNIYCDECRGKVTKEMEERKGRLYHTATANAGRGKGHDKFLRQIIVWIDIEAPRYWWSEFDTYKVGTVAQSESTMHTLSRRLVTENDFEDNLVSDIHMHDLNFRLRNKDKCDLRFIKAMLPEAYLQRRLVTLNYAVLRTIIEQRANHKLPEWQQFIKAVYSQAEHKELLPKEVD